MVFRDKVFWDPFILVARQKERKVAQTPVLAPPAYQGSRSFLFATYLNQQANETVATDQV